MVTAKLICAFVFAYADCWFSHEAALILHAVTIINILRMSSRQFISFGGLIAFKMILLIALIILLTTELGYFPSLAGKHEHRIYRNYEHYTGINWFLLKELEGQQLRLIA